jgi:hypothetical protein
MTRWKGWTKSQREMMRKTNRVYGRRFLVACAISSAIAYIVFAQWQIGQLDAMTEKIRSIQNVGAIAVPYYLEELCDFSTNTVRKELRKCFESAREDRNKLRLAYALANLGEDDTDFLVAQIETAQPDEVDNLVAALAQKENDSLAAIEEQAAACEANKKWSLKARLAVIAFHLGDPRLASDMCQIEDRPDPSERSAFIKEVAVWHGDLQNLVRKLGELPEEAIDPSLRSGLCLGVGSIEFEKEKAWTEVFNEWFETQPDTGTHSAAGFALRN